MLKTGLSCTKNQSLLILHKYMKRTLNSHTNEYTESVWLKRFDYCYKNHINKLNT